MRKLLATLLSTLLLVALTTVFTACDNSNPVDDPSKDDITHVEAVLPTCSSQGNIEYWKSGDKFYSDSECKQEITETQTVVAVDSSAHKLGDLISGESATHLKDGVKEHKECSLCHKKFGADGTTEISDIVIPELKESYTIIFDSLGGTILDDASINEADAINAEDLQTPTKDGYNFIGWFVEGATGFTIKLGVDMTVVPDLDDNGAEIIAKAKWTPYVFTVNFDTKGGSNVVGLTDNTTTIEYGEDLSEVKAQYVTTKDDYGFIGWFVEIQGDEVEIGSEALLTMPNLGADNEEITVYAKWLALPGFMGAKLDYSKFDGYGFTATATDDANYVDSTNEDTTSVAITCSGEVNVLFTQLIPASASDFDYIVWRIYLPQEQPSFCIGGGVYLLNQGWNTLSMTYDQFDASNKNIWIGSANYTFYLGSVKGYTTTTLPEFIDSDFDYTLLTKNGAVQSFVPNYDTNYTYTDEASSIKATISNSSSNAADANIYYNALLPNDAPDYDYYIWNVYSDKGVGTLFGSKSVSLKSGWNTIQLSYAELSAAGQTRVYLYCSKGTFNVYFGSLIGYKNDLALPTCIDGEMSVLRMRASSGSFTATVNSDAAYIDTDNGDESSIKVTLAAGTNFIIADCFGPVDEEKVPAATLNTTAWYEYEEYQLRIYLVEASKLSIEILGKSTGLVDGWNTITLTDDILTAKRAIYTNGACTFYLGSLTPVETSLKV